MKLWGKKRATTTLTEALRKGCKLGFEHAREHPEQTLERWLHDIDHYMEQLGKLSDEDLKKLAGE